ncbi:hypothetical protein LSTR_LSTR015027 [Laodelphax striatellus]|uniref:Uncharacterized protein n=1 Tax=Laodelphax striatellus TaxID=195883 RepID=A0A482WZW2_LAOST|nr:hypothetical protein LSTR_LSTR015027 [Laodelphax striatellus]
MYSPCIYCDGTLRTHNAHRQKEVNRKSWNGQKSGKATMQNEEESCGPRSYNKRVDYSSDRKAIGQMYYSETIPYPE